MKRLLILSFLIQALSIYAQSELHRYEISNGDSVFYSRFETETNDSLVFYRYIHKSEVHTNVYNKQGVTKKFTIKDVSKQTDLTANLHKSYIHISGSINNETIDENFELDEAPWKQSMSYSLSKFSVSEKDNIEFWIIRIDKMQAVKMLAEREDIEEIAIGNREYSAQRVKISATGLFSSLWCAHYWFEKDSGLLLKYEGLNGLPGSTKTVMKIEN